MKLELLLWKLRWTLCHSGEDETVSQSCRVRRVWFSYARGWFGRVPWGGWLEQKSPTAKTRISSSSHNGQWLFERVTSFFYSLRISVYSGGSQLSQCCGLLIPVWWQYVGRGDPQPYLFCCYFITAVLLLLWIVCDMWPPKGSRPTGWKLLFYPLRMTVNTSGRNALLHKLSSFLARAEIGMVAFLRKLTLKI